MIGTDRIVFGVSNKAKWGVGVQLLNSTNIQYNPDTNEVMFAINSDTSSEHAFARMDFDNGQFLNLASIRPLTGVGVPWVGSNGNFMSFNNSAVNVYVGSTEGLVAGVPNVSTLFIGFGLFQEAGIVITGFQDKLISYQNDSTGVDALLVRLTSDFSGFDRVAFNEFLADLIVMTGRSA